MRKSGIFLVIISISPLKKEKRKRGKLKELAAKLVERILMN